MTPKTNPVMVSLSNHDRLILRQAQDEREGVFGLLKECAVTLEQTGVHRPRWVAEQLLARRLGQSRAKMLLEPAPLTEEIQTRFLADIAACAAGVPMQYVMGTASFYGREFEVGPGVFIPRPETEVLIEVALEVLQSSNHPMTQSPSILDVGTGSGAIGVTLALEWLSLKEATPRASAQRPGIRVLATDRSEIALSFARRNADRLGAAVEFSRDDLVGSIPVGSVDLLAANLPYLDAAQAAEWPIQLHWEPWLAQDGGERGTALIRHLMQDGANRLTKSGKMVLEIGDGQAEEIIGWAQPSGLRVERVVPDLAGRDRVVLLRRDS